MIEWGRMKHSVEYRNFESLVDQVLAVSREEFLRREAEYKKQANLNPRKRGPKRKIKPAASRDSGV